MWDLAFSYAMFAIFGGCVLWLLIAAIIAAFQDYRDWKRRRYERRHKPYGFNPKDPDTYHHLS